MLIIADENIPHVRAAFDTLGDVRLLPGRAMTSAAVRDAELLLVRSVTGVDRALLDGSRVRFVGTATIGTDHVDADYLAEAGIRFAAAPGSNANSVAEYVIAALLVVAGRLRWKLSDCSIGVIGVGNVGARVARKTRALGMHVVLNDPPLHDATGDPKYRPLEELFGCDFITLHVPLERSGAYPTYHMADADFLNRLRPDAVILNTSRGAVVDDAALLSPSARRRLAAVVLDVWEGEPGINVELLRRAAVGTPHIAGYSLDGKANGTEMIYRAACEFIGVAPSWIPASHLPPPPSPVIEVSAEKRWEEDVLREVVLRAYPIERDAAALRATCDLPPERRGTAFDRLRKEYPVRREFQNFAVRQTPRTARAQAGLRSKLRGIGFNVPDEGRGRAARGGQ